MARPRVIPLDVALEVVYQVDRPPDRWLAGVVELLTPSLDYGMGVAGYFVDGSGPTLEAWDFHGPGPLTDALRRWHTDFPEDLRRLTLTRVPYGRGSALYPLWSAADVDTAADATGFVDLAGINALDARARGIVVVAPADRVLPPLSAAHEAFLAAMCRHLTRAAGIVMDRRPRDEAAIAPSALHPLEPSLSRAALREAAFRATTELPGVAGAGAAQVWRALTSRDLVLLDHFDRGGHRYHVLVQLVPAKKAFESLSERERDTVRLAAQGLLNKEIAHALGLATSTVGTLLARAATKVGAASRVHLIEAWRRVSAPPEGSPPA